MQRSGRLASAVVVLRQYLPGKHVVRVQPRAAAARDGGGLSGKAGDAGGGQYKGRQREDGWNRASTAVVHYVLLERPVTGRDASAAEGATKTTTMKMPSRLALMLSSLTSQPLRTRLEHVFLPRDYRASVSPKFLDYCKWQFVHMTTMTASGVLSMQSLLYAVGVGAGSVPLAAAINWILKDGLGQLGGMLYGSIFGTRFDDDPKRQRFNAVLSLQVSGIVDIITPLFPHHFLLLASVSNFGKNVSYLASSATRAQMNLSFTRTSNLGDVTAKMTSQSIAASVFGTGLGILVSKVTGTEAALLMAAYVPLSLVSIGGNYYSSKFVSLKTFNVQRAEILARHYFTTKAIPPPPVVAEAEGIVTAARVYRTPLHVGPNIATLPEDVREKVIQGMQGYGPYVLACARDSKDGGGSSSGAAVYIFFKRDATHAERTLGVLHACAIRATLDQQRDGGGGAAICDGALDGMPDAKAFQRECEAAGWDLQTSFFHGYDIDTAS